MVMEGREGKGRNGREGKGRNGREGKGRKGKGRKGGEGREGKRGHVVVCRFTLSVAIKLSLINVDSFMTCFVTNVPILY